MKRQKTFLLALSIAFAGATSAPAFSQGSESNVKAQQTQQVEREASFEHRRGGDDMATPYAIAPRMTFLRTDRPTLRWNAVDGATAYLVTVEGGGLSWSAEVAGTEIVYGGEALQPSTVYTVSIQADTGASSVEDSGSHLGFEVLPASVVAISNEAVAAVETAHAGNPEMLVLEKVRLFDTANLHAEAIATLEAAIANGMETAEIYGALGDAYAQTGLNLLAEASYERALELGAGDRFEARLVGVKLMLDKDEEAAALASNGALQQERFDALTEVNIVGLAGVRGGAAATESAGDIAPTQSCFPGFCYPWP